MTKRVPVEGKVYDTKYAATKGILTLEGGEVELDEAGNPHTYWSRPNGPGTMAIMRRPGDWAQIPLVAKQQAKAKIKRAKEAARKKLDKLTDLLDSIEDWYVDSIEDGHD